MHFTALSKCTPHATCPSCLKCPLWRRPAPSTRSGAMLQLLLLNSRHHHSHTFCKHCHDCHHELSHRHGPSLPCWQRRRQAIWLHRTAQRSDGATQRLSSPHCCVPPPHTKSKSLHYRQHTLVGIADRRVKSYHAEHMLLCCYQPLLCLPVPLVKGGGGSRNSMMVANDQLQSSSSFAPPNFESLFLFGPCCPWHPRRPPMMRSPAHATG
jgi:hypothetical protein